MRRRRREAGVQLQQEAGVRRQRWEAGAELRREEGMRQRRREAGRGRFFSFSSSPSPSHSLATNTSSPAAGVPRFSVSPIGSSSAAARSATTTSFLSPAQIDGAPLAAVDDVFFHVLPLFKMLVCLFTCMLIESNELSGMRI
ncbi:Os07g0194950 [Oryza sativa Japonica Group]|uniref:Os07g0194950 protein n=1 Tax=Oryza sativa subsp. japonica TaxID=39947 RepID=A0A0P0X3D4_ORYSJ|nr:hypothetical protein EE612_037654 [Oryza sativa]BAT00460.1 Os07g0194950 [Oryza sativa Japonica Group]